jgi:hypothetical protein
MASSEMGPGPQRSPKAALAAVALGILLVGLSFVKGLSFRTGIPYVGVNHLEAHLLAIHLDHEVAIYRYPHPRVGNVVPGESMQEAQHERETFFVGGELE